MSGRKNLKTGLAVVSVAVLGVLALCSVGLADELHVPSEYGTIQAAIDDTGEGDTVIVAEGIYHENISFNGTNITLTSTAPNDPAVVEATIINGNDANSVVTFSGTESIACILSGFTITNGSASCGGGIYGNGTQATIQYNIIRNNWVDPAWFPSSAFGGGLYDCDGTIRYNVITENHVVCDEGAAKGGGLYGCDGTIQYNIISNNSASGLPFGGISGGGISDCHGTIRNNTIFDNYADYGGGLSFCNGFIRNCIIWGNNVGQIYSCGADVTYSDVEGGYSGMGNIDVDPCFADPCNRDYHLKSQAGRWDAGSQSWVQDDVTSPCIDAGDMSSPIGYEPFPNGGVINMGAYGGTGQASKSYFGLPVCETVVAGDINGDCKVDFVDFALMAFHWLEDNRPVNCNSIVSDGIEYYIQTDKSVYNSGENVEMLYRVTNLRDEAVIILCSRDPVFNLWVQKDEETIWMKVHGWWWCMPPICFSAGESKKIPYVWDMRDDDGNLVEAGIYDVVGVMYNEPWNYYHHGSYTVTEVGVPISIIP